MPFFCKTVKNEQDTVLYCIQCTVTSYHGVEPNTSALTAGLCHQFCHHCLTSAVILGEVCSNVTSNIHSFVRSFTCTVIKWPTYTIKHTHRTTKLH